MSFEPKTISLLGSTGSIGTSTLDVVRRSNGRIRVSGLAAGRNVDLLVEQVHEFRPDFAAVMTRELAQSLADKVGSGTQIVWGKAGYKRIASLESVDMVVSAMVGAAGLVPTIAAIDAGKDIALANKETLVTAGSLVMQRASQKGINIIPVDSEHSAIFQCLQGNKPSMVRRLILTASGGPFRQRRKDFSRISPKEAVSHPNWSMGAKISVDSATLMNKGLELIEARWLFDIPIDRIEIVVHPQSIIHSMVEFCDGSIIAQMGPPDMRVPIAYALAWPQRMDLDLPPLDLLDLGPLTFEAPRRDSFPCLELAYRAARIGGSATTALNAANEVAVEAFLEGRIGFVDIGLIVEGVLNEFPCEAIECLDDVLRADALARLKAHALISGFPRRGISGGD